MEHWYVAHTKAHEEFKAVLHLRRQGFQAYLPRYRKRRSHARKVETVECPLFPRYLFVRMDVGRTQWRSVSSTVGVSHLICHDGVPAMVPESVVAEISAREDADGFVTVAEQCSAMPGQVVSIQAGPLVDTPGIFCSSSAQRVTVLLGFLGRQVKASLPKMSLNPNP